MQNVHLLTLPAALVADVRSLPMSRPTQNNCLLFLHETLKAGHYANRYAGTPVGIQSEKIKTDFFNGGSYRGALDMLKKRQILTINESYWYADGRSSLPPKVKEYCINYRYLSGKYTTLVLSHKMKMAGSIMKQSDKDLVKVLKGCRFDSNTAKTLTIECAASEKAWNNNRIKKGADITDTVFPSILIWNTRTRTFRRLSWVKREMLLGKWFNPQYRLYKCGKKGQTFYYMPPAEFQRMKQIGLLWHYTHVIAMWDTGRFFAHQDTKTNRLHSTATYTPKALIPCITWRGEKFKEIDLANSQFCLLAYCIDYAPKRAIIPNKITDYCRSNPEYISRTTATFCEAARSGKFYEAVQSALRLENRNDAKQATIETLFSSKMGQENDTPAKAGIRSIYPELVEMLDKFKQLHGYTELPIELQRVESQIMIGQIRPELSNSKIPNLPKHDAFLIPASYQEQTMQIVSEKLDSILGKGRYKLNCS